MRPTSLQQVAQLCGGTLVAGSGAQQVQTVSTDSRDVAPADLFLALRGEKFDGHAFVQPLAASGHVGAIVAEDYDGSSLPASFGLIRVVDTLTAYQRLAGNYRATLDCRMVAITGSNGKTSTKDLTAAVLATRYHVLKTAKNFNNHIGVPRTLLQLDDATEAAVLEVGMNHPGEIAPLAKLIQPELAIVTNIGTAHLEYMLTQEAIAAEKSNLVSTMPAAGHVFLHAEDAYTPYIKERTAAQVITVGGERADVRLERYRPDALGSLFTIAASGEEAAVRLPIPGHHMAINSLFAVAVGLQCGLALADCAEALRTVQLTGGRLEGRFIGQVTFLDDSYNANPDSMTAALRTLVQTPTSGRRVAVLGRMGELGAASRQGHEQVGTVAGTVGLDLVITVGDEAAIIAEQAKRSGVKTAIAVGDTEQACDLLGEVLGAGDLVLVKGSRSAALERVIAGYAQRVGDAATEPQSH